MRKPFLVWLDDFLKTFDKHPRLTCYFSVMLSFNVVLYVVSFVLRCIDYYAR